MNEIKIKIKIKMNSVYWFFVVSFIGFFFFSSSVAHSAITKDALMPTIERQRIDTAQARLRNAIKNPEYMLDHWIELPTAPNFKTKKSLHLSIRDAVLLALRYNPNIQNAELDRVLQRYQLRLAQNEFELQYSLAGTAMVTNSNYSGVGNAMTKSYIAIPEFSLKNPYGSEAVLKMDNNVSVDGNYNPLASFSFRQPLLRGFGRAANEAALLNAIDNETLNKLGLQQAVIDQITQVIVMYRTLILNANNLQIQQQQFIEAQHEFDNNQKEIASGQLEPTANIQQSYQVESLRLVTEQAEQEFRTATQDLLQAIGLDPNIRLSILTDVTLDNLAVPDVEASVAQALNHNLQYQALKMVIRSDERAYKAEQNRQLWQLDLTTNVQAGTITNVDRNRGLRDIYSGNNVNEVGSITLSVPLHDLNRRQSLIAVKIKLEKDRLNLIASKRALITTIKNSIITIQSLVRRYDFAKRQVDWAAKSYVLEKKKQQAGIANALDVNNTQNQWTQAQKGLISAKIDYLNQLSILQRLLGTTLDHWQITLRYSG
ncbi:MAG: TolC family protein [Legionellaceae bacterium]|nr:TolC family protein [Legionellaceae bacterium]